MISDNDFSLFFTETLGFDDSLHQTGQSNTESGYLENEEALKSLKEKQSDWERVKLAASSVKNLGYVGMPLFAFFGAIGDLLSIKLSAPIDRIVLVMEILLKEFKEEGITIIPRVRGNDGTIDLFIKTADKRYFAIMLRSNGGSRIKWRKDRQQFFTIGRGRNSTWGRLELLGDELNRIVLSFKKEKNPIVGSTNAERNRAFTKAIVLTGKTRLDPNNDPEFMVPFGLTTALRVTTTSTFYLVDLANLANFLRKPVDK